MVGILAISSRLYSPARRMRGWIESLNPGDSLAWAYFRIHQKCLHHLHLRFVQPIPIVQPPSLDVDLTDFPTIGAVLDYARHSSADTMDMFQGTPCGNVCDANLQCRMFNANLVKEIVRESMKWLRQMFGPVLGRETTSGTVHCKAWRQYIPSQAANQNIYSYRRYGQRSYPMDLVG